jgi:hypothetical protein
MTGATGPSLDRWTLGDWETHLSAGSAAAVFTSHEIAGLSEPVRRYFDAAIEPGTRLSTCITLAMRGHIKVGRPLPFSARQVLNPHRGFLWQARAAAVIAGYDRYLDDVGAMSWKVLGRLGLASAAGPDVSRSAAGRGVAEGIWVPTAMLPRFGVTWTASDESHIAAHCRLGATPVDLHLTLDEAGQIRSLVFDRWGDPDRTGSWAWHSFGGTITGYRTFAGSSIPSQGRLGWHVDADGRSNGEFFRYEITSRRGAQPRAT